MKTPLKTAARVLVTLIIVAAAIIAARYLWLHYMEKPWTRDGRVRATILNVAPDVSGLVTAIAIKDNQPVRVGDLLFTIDTERYKLALAQARLAIETAQANIKTAQDGVKTAQDAVKTAQDNVKTAQDNLDYQQHELDRHRRLRETNANTQEDLDRAQNAVTVATNALASAQNAVTAAQNGVTAAQNAVTAAENARRQALAALATAELNVARAEVRSPVNGIVTNLQLEVGDYAAAGKPMLAIVNTDTLYVAGYFEETKMRYIRVGAPATVELMGYKQPLRGRVESIAPAITDRDNVQNADLVANVNPTFSWVRLPQRIPVRITLDKIPEDLQLTAGMTATIIIEEPKSKNTSSN